MFNGHEIVIVDNNYIFDMNTFEGYKIKYVKKEGKNYNEYKLAFRIMIDADGEIHIYKYGAIVSSKAINNAVQHIGKFYFRKIVAYAKSAGVLTN